MHASPAFRGALQALHSQDHVYLLMTARDECPRHPRPAMSALMGISSRLLFSIPLGFCSRLSTSRRAPLERKPRGRNPHAARGAGRPLQEWNSLGPCTRRRVPRDAFVFNSGAPVCACARVYAVREEREEFGRFYRTSGWPRGQSLARPAESAALAGRAAHSRPLMGPSTNQSALLLMLTLRVYRITGRPPSARLTPFAFSPPTHTHTHRIVLAARCLLFHSHKFRMPRVFIFFQRYLFEIMTFFGCSTIANFFGHV